MSNTVTISLPLSFAQQMDYAVKTEGFATRSEFIRNLLRRYFTRGLEIETFIPVPTAEIKENLANTGKYNRKFINSVTKGLAKSSIYAN